MSYAISTADDITSYLASRGWGIASQGPLGALWKAPELRAESALVAVPGEIDSRKMEWPGIVARIAEAERVSPRSVQESIQRQYIDVTEFRAANDLLIEGSIPLEAGFSLFSSARTVVRVSATTSRGAKARIGGAYSASGDRIAESARFGHTIPGSYIVPVYMPLPREKTQPKESPLEIPGERTFYESEERRVTRTMAQALTALKTLVVDPASEPRSSVVADLVTAGVSREMVLAIHKVVSDVSVATFDTSFSWAGAFGEPPNLPAHVQIPSQSAELLNLAAHKMKISKKSTIEALTGLIVQLRDERDIFGSVVIQTVRRGRPSEVTVRLKDPDLAETHEWFKQRRALVVEGNVISDPGRPLRIDAVRRIQPLDETFLTDAGS